MHRVSKKLALLACALAVAACSGQSKTNSADSTAQPGDGQTFYSVHVVKPTLGLVTDSSGQINCGALLSEAACDGNYLFTNPSPTFTATATTGFHWKAWAGDAIGAANNAGAINFSDLAPTINKADKTVVAVFEKDGGDAPLPPVANFKGRIYGYAVDETGAKVAGVKLLSGALTATSNAAGAFVIDADPGTYSFVISDTNSPARYTVGAAVSVTVPNAGACTGAAVGTVPAGADATITQSAAAVGGENVNGCLVPVYVAVNTNGTYSNLTAATIDLNAAIAGVYLGTKANLVDAAGATTGIALYNAGFGSTATLACDAGGTGTIAWKQTNGPTTIATAAWGANPSFTLPTIADLQAASAAAEPVCVANPADPSDLICTPVAACPFGAGAPTGNPKVGCGVSNFKFEGRPRLFPINKQQSGELTYTFTCTVTSGLYKTVKTFSFVQASMVNANPGNAIIPPTISAGAPRVAEGVLVIGDDYRACAAGETATAPPFTMPDCGGVSTSTSCQHICRDGTPYAWTLVTTALPALIPVASLPVLYDAAGQHPWAILPMFTAPTNSASASWTLQNDAKANGVITFTEARWSAFENSCHQCHGSPTYPNAIGGTTTTPEVVDEWKASKHNNIIVDGMGGTHYSSSCLPCHSVGYNIGLANNGWDDVAALASYKLPDFTFTGATDQLQFANMPVTVKNMSNVQCQNCHGPVTSPASNPQLNGRAHSDSASSNVCGSCHDGGTHGIFSQWKTTGHANLLSAQNEGPLHGADQTSCARCHYAQGNFTYRAQIAAMGNPDKFDTKFGPVISLAAGSVSKAARTQTTAGNVKVTVTLPSATSVGQTAWYCVFQAPDEGTFISPAVPAPGPFTSGAKAVAVAVGGLSFSYNERAAAGALAVTNQAIVTCQAQTMPAPANVTVDNVEAIGCQTCHNPHSLELTVPGTGVMALAAGFSIQDAGAGMLCASCHNSRNGILSSGAVVRRIDATPLTSTIGLGTPHAAAQADVYFAGNGYLLGTPAPQRLNPHQNPSFFKDTCAECHVKRFTAATEGKTVANHTFGVDANTCVSCHGAGNELVSREVKVTDRLAVYGMVLSNVVKNAGITAIGKTVSVATGSLSKPAASSVVTAVVSGHGLVTGTYATLAAATADNTATTFRNGSYVITVVDASTFTFDDTRVNAGASAVLNTAAASITGSTDVTSRGGVVGGAPAIVSRNIGLTLKFADSTSADCVPDYILSGTTPTFYTGTLAGTRTYGKVVKSMYNKSLIENDKSYGVHNIPFVDGMLDAMITQSNYGSTLPY